MTQHLQPTHRPVRHTRHRRPRRGAPALISSLSVLVVLGSWFIAAAAGGINTLFIPAPWQLWQAFLRLLAEGYMGISLGQHIAASLLRVLSALMIAMVTAIPLGIVMGLNRTWRAAVDPLINFYRPIPPLAYLPLIVIWFGIGEFSKILLIYLAILAPLVISTYEAVRKTDLSRVRAVRCLGASRGQVIGLVILPGIVPELLTGLRIALGAGWSTLVAAELIAANRGLGFMVQSASQYLATDVVVAGIVLIALVALSIELLLSQIQKRLAGWSLYEYHR